MADVHSRTANVGSCSDASSTRRIVAPAAAAPMEAASAAAAHQSVHENDGAPLHVPTLVEALLEMRLDALRRLLPRASSTHKTMVLACPSFSGHRGYLIGSELFVTQPPSTTGVGVCAGVRSYKLSYRFGDGGCRSKIAQLLSLMHAQPGDTLLHLALRINGAHPADKVALVTELLGHGFEFALENASGQLPAVLDPPCFRSAFFKEIPHWRAARAAEAQQLLDLDEQAKRERESAEEREQVEAERERRAEEVLEQYRQEVSPHGRTHARTHARTPFNAIHSPSPTPNRLYYYEPKPKSRHLSL